MSSFVILKSGDDKVFRVPMKVAECSRTLRTMLEDLGGGATGEEEEIPLPLSGVVLEKVIEWAEHHKDDLEATEESAKEKSGAKFSDWDKQFFKVDREILFALILASNYLDIKGLLDMSAQTVADAMIKGKNPSQILEAFGIRKGQ